MASMKSPEVLSFSLPDAARVHAALGRKVDLPSHATSLTLVLLPGQGAPLHVPAQVRSAILAHCDSYYSVQGYPLPEVLLDPLFVQAFVLGGRLIMTSARTVFSSCPAVLLTEDGVLTLAREGLKKPNVRKIDLKVAGKHELHEVKIWLREEFAGPNNTTEFCFNWIPNDENVCPSSLAKFFHDKGAQVQETSLTERILRKENLKFPRIPYRCSEMTLEDLTLVEERLGALMLNIELPQWLESGSEGRILAVTFEGLFGHCDLAEIVRQMQNSKLPPWSACILWSPLLASGTNGLRQNNSTSLIFDSEGAVIRKTSFQKVL